MYFGQGKGTITGSVAFLTSYSELLNGAVNKESGLALKGKEKAHMLLHSTQIQYQIMKEQGRTGKLIGSRHHRHG
jgi:hypothetical protein